MKTTLVKSIVSSSLLIGLVLSSSVAFADRPVHVSGRGGATHRASSPAHVYTPEPSRRPIHVQDHRYDSRPIHVPAYEEVNHGGCGADDSIVQAIREVEILERELAQVRMDSAGFDDARLEAEFVEARVSLGVAERIAQVRGDRYRFESSIADARSSINAARYRVESLLSALDRRRAEASSLLARVEASPYSYYSGNVASLADSARRRIEYAADLYYARQFADVESQLLQAQRELDAACELIARLERGDRFDRPYGS